MRPLLSYDDLVPANGDDFNNGPEGSSGHQKGRKAMDSHRTHSSLPQRHWDDPVSSTAEQSMAYDEQQSVGRKRKRDDTSKAKSRRLTHEEIWDDSALIDAWDAAMEEYEALNGPGREWKFEPLHKSALWYNVPVLPADEETEDEDADVTLDDVKEGDSHPVDFDTFIPSHDPSLNFLPNAEGPNSSHPVPSQSWPVFPSVMAPAGGAISSVSREEAFQRATQSWYWAGYWTAIYHSTLNRSGEPHRAPSPKFSPVDPESSSSVQDNKQVDEDLTFPTER